MSWADRNLDTLGDFDAFVLGDRVWRSSMAHDQAARMASALVAMGVVPGDRVLLWLPSGPELAIAWRAVVRAGSVAVLAHHDSPRQRIEDIAAEMTPAALVTSAARVGAEPVGAAIRHRIHVDAEEVRPGWRSVGQIVAEHGPLVDPIRRDAHDMASIIYTSGTTGTPKGLVTRHDTLTASFKGLRPLFAPRRRPLRHLALLPMSSAFGSSVLFEGLAKKCTTYFLDRFDPEQILDTIERHRIHRTALVPTMCEALLAAPDVRRYDVSSLGPVVCGGAHVPPDLVDRCRQRLGIRLRNGYGLSEIGGVSSASFRSKPGSAGRPRRGLNAKVVDPEGHALPTGEIGEVVLRVGDHTSVEYWNPGSSVSVAAGPGGWYRTGDTARFDARGELYIVGRTDDLIIQGGHNIHGQTIAEIVLRLPGVRESAAVGVPNEYLGQEAVVCVALQHGARLTAGDIIAHCREHLEARAVPASVWFVDALPRNELGKVKGHELRAAIHSARGVVHDTSLVRRLEAAPAAARRALLRAEVRRLTATVLRDSVQAHETADATFRDLGLDSVGAVELTHALSDAVGRAVPATLVYTHPTIDGVCGFLLDLLGWRSDAGSRTSAEALAAPPLASPEALRLADFFSPRDREAARQSTPWRDRPHGAQVVFLTGANGFLGRFLVLQILKRLPLEDGRLYCLVRPGPHASPHDRLRASYGSDPSLQDLFDRLSASGRLTVLGGDFTQPRFGLPDETYARLCGEVDCIVHNGAVVDHLLGYPELFAPNVLATVEIARFAVAQRMKPINYVSTVAVLGVARRPFFRRHKRAAGYSSSKWASESVLKELHEQFGVPVRIYRPSWILAHRESPGQINAQDTFTRLLQGIVSTALAPRSFYASGRSGDAGHYDGLPVDVVARSIAALNLAEGLDRTGHIEYHVVGPHRGVSLDVIIEWVRSAGYRIEQIDDYAAWYRDFGNRLNTMNRSKRRQSLLPLLHAWERPLEPRAARYDTASLHDHLARLSENGATERLTEFPLVDEAFIHKCLADMRVLGLIDPAG